MTITTFRWWADAACMSIERNGEPLDSAARTALFFPREDDEDSTAFDYPKSICNSCPVVKPCLDDAILEERHTIVPSGIRGGMTGLERQAERVRREGGYARRY